MTIDRVTLAIFYIASQSYAYALSNLCLYCVSGECPTIGQISLNLLL